VRAGHGQLGVMEILVVLIKIVEGIHGLKWLIGAARSNPQSTVALSILVLAGAVVALIMRRARRSDFPGIR
jgi:hypothetical protein